MTDSKLWKKGHHHCVHVVGGGALDLGGMSAFPGFTAALEALATPQGTIMISLESSKDSAVLETYDWEGDADSKLLCYSPLLPASHTVGTVLYSVGGVTANIDEDSVLSILCGFNLATGTLAMLNPLPIATLGASLHSGISSACFGTCWSQTLYTAVGSILLSFMGYSRSTTAAATALDTTTMESSILTEPVDAVMTVDNFFATFSSLPSGYVNRTPGNKCIRSIPMHREWDIDELSSRRLLRNQLPNIQNTVSVCLGFVLLEMKMWPQASFVGMGRMRPMCSSYGDRYICIGGYSSQTGSVLSGAATFWAGANYIQVEQFLPESLYQHHSTESLNLLPQQIEEARERAIFTDRRCSIKISSICG